MFVKLKVSDGGLGVDTYCLCAFLCLFVSGCETEAAEEKGFDEV